jgi:VWFA-related protein
MALSRLVVLALLAGALLLPPAAHSAAPPPAPPLEDPDQAIDRAMAEAGLAVRSPAAAPAASGASAAPPLSEEITVAITTLVARVVDSRGEPVRGLAPADFRVRIGAATIPVLAVDWVSSDPDEEIDPIAEAIPQETAGSTPFSAQAAPSMPRGQLQLFFVQANLEATRAKGQLRLLPLIRDLLDTMKPDDRAAVVSFDSHLKLWLDFTDDREALYEAITRAVRAGGEDWARPNRKVVSLARVLDAGEAARAATPERGLALVAEALAELPGDKSIVWLGWGLGRYGFGGITMGPHYDGAVATLRSARVPVFVLDVTSDDYHTLEVGLESVAASTGGSYAKTNISPEQAVHRLARTLSGHYLLTLDREQVPKGGGKVRIELVGKKGEILTAPVLAP